MSGGKPRVLMVLKRSGGLGGLQVQAGRVCLRLQERGIPVSLITRSPERGGEPVWWSRRLPAHFLPGPGQWRFASQVYRHLRRFHKEYDLVHVHGLAPETFAAMLARRTTGKPLIVKPSTAGPGTRLGAYARWGSAAPGPARALWRSVDAWASISEETRADLVRMGVEPGRIASVPNGVDPRVHHPLDEAARERLREELGLAPRDLLLLCVARLTPHKRVDLLLGAYFALAREFPLARLWIVGHGEQEPALRRQVESSPFGEQVRFWGRTRSDQVARMMQAADLFVLLSLWEGLSNALLEAMACGVPPVVTRVSGMADVVRHDTTGLLVPPDDEKAAREALHMLLEDQDRRLRLGAAAAASIHESYTLDRTAARLEDLYLRLLEEASR